MRAGELVQATKGELVEAATERRTTPVWAARTYNYLRLGMLVGVAALAYSIIEEYLRPGAHCLLGSISGYYYTPVRPIFIGVMVSIGFALIVIKGRRGLEDWFLSLAGIMAPIVAFIPTSDDMKGVCRPEMLSIGRYQRYRASDFVPASINNNLHALVFAGYAAIVLVLIFKLIQKFIQWRDTRSTTVQAPADTEGDDSAVVVGFTRRFWIGAAGGLALAITGSILLRWGYDWVLDGHARAALVMFAFLAAAALTNSWFGFKRGDTTKPYALAYGFVGGLMIAFGVLFVLCQEFNWLRLGGHRVLAIEFIEIVLFAIFWGFQTVERWNQTVFPAPVMRSE